MKTTLSCGFAHSMARRFTLRCHRTLINILLLGFVSGLFAQDLSDKPNSHAVPSALPMQAVVYEIDQAANEKNYSVEQLAEVIDQNGLNRNADGWLDVEIVNQAGREPLPLDILERVGAKFQGAWRKWVNAWVAPHDLARLAAELPSGYYLEAVRPPVPTYEGPIATGSDDYRDNGANGNGISIGVIDIGYSGLTAAVSAGNAPVFYTTYNYTATGFEAGTITHGTGCIEQVFDHAPAATFFFYKIDSQTDLGTAVDQAVLDGVDILTMSLSYFNTGWDDGTGLPCEAVQEASLNDIIFFNGAGNFAQKHFQGTFDDTDGDNWHNFSSVDEVINITIDDDKTAIFNLCWDTNGGTFDYDLYLYNSSLTIVLESGTNSGENFESFSYKNETGATESYRVAIQQVSGGATELELFIKDATWEEHIVSESSTTSPSNTTAIKSFSVGAVDEEDFSSPSGTSGIIMSYSGNGPTNSGGQAPDVVGPTNTTITGGATFTGSSCAAPNAAGATAAFWSSAPHMSAWGVTLVVRGQALALRDWGTSGVDYTYGYGGVQLHDYADNTQWVDREALNLLGIPDLPYFYIDDAQDAVATPGRIVILGDAYSEGVTLDKGFVTYESIGSNAYLGGSGTNTSTREKEILAKARVEAEVEVSDTTLNSESGRQEESILLPDEFSLLQNYPNPFNPTTSIQYALPQQSHVRLAVFDFLGRKVRDLLNGTLAAGYHEHVWDATNNYGERVASGVYLYRFSAESIGEKSQGFTQTKKMILLR